MAASQRITKPTRLYLSLSDIIRNMKNKNRLKKNALLEKEVETAKTANTRNLNSVKKLFSGGSSYS